MNSFLFQGLMAEPDSLVVEGVHKPGTLTLSSGAWIHSAGRAMFTQAERIPLNCVTQWVWIAVKQGSMTLDWQGTRIDMAESNSCILPADRHDVALEVTGPVSVLWMAIDGPLASLVVRKMGALLHSPLKQTALPS